MDPECLDLYFYLTMIAKHKGYASGTKKGYIPRETSLWSL